MCFRVARAICVFALLVGCSTSGSPEPDQVTEPAGQLLVNQSPDSSIVEYDIASGDSRPITRNGELSATARWSPDDRQIAMAQQVFRRIRVVVVDADGQPVATIEAPGDVDEGVPTWSPDCRSLAVGRFSLDSADAWVASLDGRGSQRLGGPPDVSGFDWSDAAGRIAMFRLAQPYGTGSVDAGTATGDAPPLDDPDLVGLLTMRADGSQVQVVAGTGAGDEWPRWSPDGSTLAFDREVDGVRQVFSVDDAGSATQLTDGDSAARGPIWSPDGEWLAYRSGETDTGTISLVRADGTDQRELAVQGTPTDWGPHGGTCPQIGNSGRSLP